MGQHPGQSIAQRRRIDGSKWVRRLLENRRLYL